MAELRVPTHIEADKRLEEKYTERSGFLHPHSFAYQQGYRDALRAVLERYAELHETPSAQDALTLVLGEAKGALEVK